MRQTMRALVAAVLLVVACHDAADKPLEPVWGKQPCDHCAMLLDEPRFAAQAATADGTHVYFDDVGCLASWLREHPSPKTRAWVRAKEQWVDVATAHFSTGERTPMGYGFVAAPGGPAAPATIDWREVQRRVGERADAQ